MIHKVISVAKTDKSDNCQDTEEDLALLARLNVGYSKIINVVNELLLSAMCGMRVLVFTKAAGLIKVIPHEIVAKIYK